MYLPSNSSEETDPCSEETQRIGGHTPTPSGYKPHFGRVVKAPIPFKTTVLGNRVSGSYRVRYAHVDEDEVDGTDVFEFTWKTESDEEYKTFHMPDLVFRFMFQENLKLRGKFCTDSAISENEAFENCLLVQEAKALVDDRTYEKIRISDNDYEIKLKYLGLRVSFAALHDDKEHLLALISGVLCENDILEPFVVRIPLRSVAHSSTAKFDIEEGMWVHV